MNDKVVCKPLGSRTAYSVEPTSGDDVVEGEVVGDGVCGCRGSQIRVEADHRPSFEDG